MDISVLQEKQAVLVAKAVAILAVVGLHALALFPESIYMTSMYKNIFIFINQFARFSVPLFLALSGFGLARKYQNKSLEKKKFIFDRAAKLLPLYILWSVILFLSMYASKTWSSGVETSFFQSLLLGNIDYHLYFVPLIFQFYILFSLLLTKMNTRRRVLSLLAISGLLQIVWFLIIRYLSVNEFPIAAKYLSDQTQYRLIISWFFYFLSGVFLAQIDLDRLRSSKIFAILIGVLIIAGLGWSVYDSSLLLSQTKEVIFSTSFIRLPVLLYAASFIGGVIIYGPLLLVKLRHDASQVLQTIGKYSYVIYLSHTLLLRIVEGIITEGPQAITLARASVLLFIGVIISITEMR